MPEISSKAIVLNPGGLADDVKVGPFSFLGGQVTVAAGTVIANNVTILGRTSIGSNCRLFPGCVVGCPPDGGTGPTPLPGGAPAPLDDSWGGVCVIGPRNVIREHVTIESGAEGAGAGTRVGVNNLLMVGCKVGHDAVLEDEGHFVNFTQVGHHACIEKYVRTSGFNTVAPYATLGAYTLTTGYVAVDRDAPPFAIIDGLPFRVRGVNAENLRRCGFKGEMIATVKAAFRILFDADADFPDESRLARAEKDFSEKGGEPVRFLIASLRASAASPGFCRRRPAGAGVT